MTTINKNYKSLETTNQVYTTTNNVEKYLSVKIVIFDRKKPIALLKTELQIKKKKKTFIHIHGDKRKAINVLYINW